MAGMRIVAQIGLLISIFLFGEVYRSTNHALQAVEESLAEHVSLENLQRSALNVYKLLAWLNIGVFQGRAEPVDEAVALFASVQKGHLKQADAQDDRDFALIAARLSNFSKSIQSQQEISGDELTLVSAEVESLASRIEVLAAQRLKGLIEKERSLLRAQSTVNDDLRWIAALFTLSALALVITLRSRLNLEKTSRLNEQKFQSVFRSLAEGVLLADSHGKILEANESAKAILGLRRGIMLGAGLKQLFGLVLSREGGVLSDQENPVYQMIDGGQDTLVRTVGIYLGTGEIRWIYLSLKAIRSKTEDSRLFLISFLDIGANIAAEEMIKRQQAQIVNSATLSTLGEMASGIAHEINNPLAIISAKAEELSIEAEGGVSVESTIVKNITDMIIRTVMRTAKIVHSIRGMARNATNDPVESTKVRDMVMDAVELCQNKVKSRQIQMKCAEISTDLSIDCRFTQISQVLVNLISNGADAIENLPDKWISIEVKDLGAGVEISVTDSGAGIPSAIRNRIMQPFFTTKPVGKGTGIGLSISRTIIEQHQGRLDIDNSSKNTRFVIWLPKNVATQAAA